MRGIFICSAATLSAFIGSLEAGIDHVMMTSAVGYEKKYLLHWFGDVATVVEEPEKSL